MLKRMVSPAERSKELPEVREVQPSVIGLNASPKDKFEALQCIDMFNEVHSGKAQPDGTGVPVLIAPG